MLQVSKRILAIREILEFLRLPSFITSPSFVEIELEKKLGRIAVAVSDAAPLDMLNKFSIF